MAQLGYSKLNLLSAFPCFSTATREPDPHQSTTIIIDKLTDVALKALLLGDSVQLDHWRVSDDVQNIGQSLGSLPTGNKWICVNIQPSNLIFITYKGQTVWGVFMGQAEAVLDHVQRDSWSGLTKSGIIL